MNTPSSLFGALLAGVLCVPVLASPSDFGANLANLTPSRLLTNDRGQNRHWSGVGRVRNETNTLCTASLLDTRNGEGNATGPAYIITSSHCIHRTNEFVHKDMPLKGSISFNYFDDTLAALKTYPLKTLKWSSSQGVDLAIIELDSALATLIDNGITPLKLAEEAPADGSDILALSAPAWDTLRLSACTQQASAEIVEQPYVWRVTMKNQCQGIAPGSFGGPLLNRQSNEIFGILGTSTRGSNADKKCQRDAPCEVKNGIATRHADSNYGSPVTFLRSCFVEGVLHSNIDTCDLYPTTVIGFKNPQPIKQYYVTANKGSKSIIPTWDLRFTINTPFYRYKTTRRAIDCENPALYSAPVAAENAYINDPIGPQTGMHMLCVVGVESAEQPVTPGMMKNALTLAVELAEPGPARTPDVSISLDKEGLQAYTVKWKMAPPFMSRYTYKMGPAHSTDCLRPVGYLAIPLPRPEPEDDDEGEDIYHHPLEDQAITPADDDFIQIVSTNTHPIKICTYAYDQADQPSTLRVDILKPR